jgi:hypothetical protein
MGIDHPHSADPDIDSGMLRPLYKCSRLSELTFWTVYAVQDISLLLDDGDIIELAGALKEPRILHFGSNSRFLQMILPRMSLKAVHILASCCPKLKHLILTIDARKIPSNPPISERPGLPSSIRTLNFGHSLIENPREVADYLGHVCRANGIGSQEWDPKPNIKGWVRVPEEGELKKNATRWSEVARYMKSIQLMST